MSMIASTFSKLTWDDLTGWAGDKIVSRGNSYKKNVRDLCITEEGFLLAWVQGTDLYATSVGLDQDGEICSACSCPYSWGPCKHSVAVILVYLDSLKTSKPIKRASPDDQRLKLLSRDDTGGVFHDDEDWDSEDDYDLDDEELEDDESGAEGLESLSTERSETGKARSKSGSNALRKILETKTKNELIEFLLDVAENYPAIGQSLLDAEDLKKGKVDGIVRSLRREIQEISSEQGWSNHWSGESSTPDYSDVRRQLKALMETGHADEVVTLGEELWNLGNEQVGMSDDEGETAGEIAECMEIVFQAIPHSSLPPVRQILWMIDRFIEDGFSLLENVEDCLSVEHHAKNDWSQAADALLVRLKELPEPVKQDYSSDRYKREHVMNWAIEALLCAGRKAEVIPLLEREAPVSYCYVTLVEHLLSANRKEDARQAAVDGFGKTIEHLPGIAWELERKLREIAQRDKDLPLAAAYCAWEFFKDPSLSTYRDLEATCLAAGKWPDVRENILHFLETGIRPDIPTVEGKKTNPPAPPKPWPLPATEISSPKTTTSGYSSPNFNILIDVAIYEKRNDDVAKLYESCKKKGRGSCVDDSVAKAVQKSHPEISLQIWQQRAESQIGLVKPSAYTTAAGYLRKMKKLYEQNGRRADWDSYLSAIRTKHKAKRKLMEVLDSLEGKPIIDS